MRVSSHQFHAWGLTVLGVDVGLGDVDVVVEGGAEGREDAGLNLDAAPGVVKTAVVGQEVGGDGGVLAEEPVLEDAGDDVVLDGVFEDLLHLLLVVVVVLAGGGPEGVGRPTLDGVVGWREERHPFW